MNSESLPGLDLVTSAESLDFVTSIESMAAF